MWARANSSETSGGKFVSAVQSRAEMFNMPSVTQESPRMDRSCFCWMVLPFGKDERRIAPSSEAVTRRGGARGFDWVDPNHT